MDDGVIAATASTEPFAEPLRWALAAELISHDADDRLRLTTRGRLLSNELFARLV